jgi:hypothetical protein
MLKTLQIVHQSQVIAIFAAFGTERISQLSDAPSEGPSRPVRHDGLSNPGRISPGRRWPEPDRHHSTDHPTRAGDSVDPGPRSLSAEVGVRHQSPPDTNVLHLMRCGCLCTAEAREVGRRRAHSSRWLDWTNPTLACVKRCEVSAIEAASTGLWRLG